MDISQIQRWNETFKCQKVPGSTPQKNMQITKTSYLLMGYTGITNSLWTSSKILSASVFDLFVQSADSCRLCGMIFLSEAPRFLALKIIKSHGKRSLIQILLIQEWIWESQNSSVPSSKILKSQILLILIWLSLWYIQANLACLGKIWTVLVKLEE